MEREEVRDANGKLLFFYETLGTRREVRDANGALLGFMEGEKTRDADGRLIFQGNAGALLYKGPVLL